MAYYFPFGAASAVSVQNISYSFAAVTASRPETTTILLPTASFADSVQNTPIPGLPGLGKNIDSCSADAPRGEKGVQGPRGQTGSAYENCPPGTIECVGLNVSLSGAFPGYPYGINHILPSGSRYSKVCLEIRPGCTSAQMGCPSSLPLGTWPSIP